MLKVVVAIIKPFKLDEVKDALQAMGVPGLTVSEAQGYGRQRGHTEVYRGAEYRIDFTPKVRLEVLCRDDDALAVVDRVIEVARTGKIGDGKVFISNIEDAVRIRTEERGEKAV